MSKFTATEFLDDIDDRINTSNDITDNTNKNILKSAVSVIEMLSHENQKKVLNFSVELLETDADSPFRPKTEEELFDRIDRSLAQVESGESRDADEVFDDLIAELELEAV